MLVHDAVGRIAAQCSDESPMRRSHLNPPPRHALFVQLKLRHMMPSGEVGARLTDRNWSWAYNLATKVRLEPP